MLPITRNAKEPRSNMTVQYLSQNQPKPSLRGFSVLRHPNHLLLTGQFACRRKQKKRHHYRTQRFHAAPDQKRHH